MAGFQDYFLSSTIFDNFSERPLNVDLIQNVLELIIWFHYINIFKISIADKSLSIKLNYRFCNSICMVVRKLFPTWTYIMQHVGNDALIFQLLRNLWYSGGNVSFEKLKHEKRLSPISQIEYLTPSVRHIWSSVGFDETSACDKAETDHAVRHLTFALLFKLKKIVVKNSIYNLDGADVLNFPSIRSLLPAYGAALQFYFS